MAVGAQFVALLVSPRTPGSAKGPPTGDEGSIMAEQIPSQAGPETEPSKPRTGTSSLHLASGDDAIEEARTEMIAWTPS